MNCPKPWAIDAPTILTLPDACNKEMYVLWQAIAVLVDYGLALEKNDVGKALVNMTMQPKPDFTPTRKAIQLSKPGAGVRRQERLYNSVNQAPAYNPSCLRRLLIMWELIRPGRQTR